MADLSEFEALSSKRNTTCKIGTALELLTGEEQNLFNKAVENRERVATGALAKWLQVRGHKVNQSSAVSHRAKTCSCYA